ncbi:hypothetical protein [Streptomyces sirii]|uniref:hypothetical protein n=1 Tax=Streptomyces sirii TaxID=3127701 RepID=UPI003D36C219
MIYLLDTDVISEISVRPRPAPEVVSWAKSLPSGNMYLSVITIGEIEAGIAAAPDSRRRAHYAQASDDLRQVGAGRIGHPASDYAPAVARRSVVAIVAEPTTRVPS